MLPPQEAAGDAAPLRLVRKQRGEGPRVAAIQRISRHPELLDHAASSIPFFALVTTDPPESAWDQCLQVQPDVTVSPCVGVVRPCRRAAGRLQLRDALSGCTATGFHALIVNRARSR